MIKKLKYGIGYNSRTKHRSSIDGNMTKSYTTWSCMIQRCYDPKYHLKTPTYIDCYVDERWHDFQDFAEWYENHEYSGLGFTLDKDILTPDNKAYSPETCCFVPQEVNKLLNNRRNVRGDLPQGVVLHKRLGRYQAQLNTKEGKRHLGYFDCPNDAYKSYKLAKEDHVKYVANLWFGSIETRAYEALMNWELPCEN